MRELFTSAVEGREVGNQFLIICVGKNLSEFSVQSQFCNGTQSQGAASD